VTGEQPANACNLVVIEKGNQRIEGSPDQPHLLVPRHATTTRLTAVTIRERRADGTARTEDSRMRTSAISCDIRETWDREGSLGCSEPETIGREIRPKLNSGLTLLLFAALFITISAGWTQAATPEPALASAASTGETADHGNAGQSSDAPPAAHAEEEHGLPQAAVEIARPFGFPITNSMIVSWIVALLLIIFAQVATRNMKQVPEGAQNFMEWLVETLYGFLEGILGPHLVRKTFWFFATIFIFILSTNWAGLIPGVGTIGWGHQTDSGFKIDQPFFRGANADVNLTFAMALVFFACWIVWALQEIGPVGFVKELFAPKGESEGLLRVLMVVVFFAAGLLELVSILFRPISLSFRLYGNIFAGENMLEAMARLVPGFGWLVPIPFYFLELLMGLVQAMVFMLLTAVFTLLICQHEGEGPASAHG
jgi:F-type H+-transporting ATPase subunit a